MSQFPPNPCHPTPHTGAKGGRQGLRAPVPPLTRKPRLSAQAQVWSGSGQRTNSLSLKGLNTHAYHSNMKLSNVCYVHLETQKQPSIRKQDRGPSCRRTALGQRAWPSASHQSLRRRAAGVTPLAGGSSNGAPCALLTWTRLSSINKHEAPVLPTWDSGEGRSSVCWGCPNG